MMYIEGGKKEEGTRNFFRKLGERGKRERGDKKLRRKEEYINIYDSIVLNHYTLKNGQ